MAREKVYRIRAKTTEKSGKAGGAEMRESVHRKIQENLIPQVVRTVKRKSNLGISADVKAELLCVKALYFLSNVVS